MIGKPSDALARGSTCVGFDTHWPFVSVSAFLAEFVRAQVRIQVANLVFPKSAQCGEIDVGAGEGFRLDRNG